MHGEESPDANSELFKEDDDEAMYKNPYEIRLCYLISVSQINSKHAAGVNRILVSQPSPRGEGARRADRVLAV